MLNTTNLPKEILDQINENQNRSILPSELEESIQMIIDSYVGIYKDKVSKLIDSSEENYILDEGGKLLVLLLTLINKVNSLLDEVSNINNNQPNIEELQTKIIDLKNDLDKASEESLLQTKFLEESDKKLENQTIQYTENIETLSKSLSTMRDKLEYQEKDYDRVISLIKSENNAEKIWSMRSDFEEKKNSYYMSGVFINDSIKVYNKIYTKIENKELISLDDIYTMGEGYFRLLSIVGAFTDEVKAVKDKNNTNELEKRLAKENEKNKGLQIEIDKLKKEKLEEENKNKGIVKLNDDLTSKNAELLERTKNYDTMDKENDLLYKVVDAYFEVTNIPKTEVIERAEKGRVRHIKEEPTVGEKFIGTLMLTAIDTGKKTQASDDLDIEFLIAQKDRFLEEKIEIGKENEELKKQMEEMKKQMKEMEQTIELQKQALLKNNEGGYDNLMGEVILNGTNN